MSPRESKRTCFLCGDNATSGDHIPPRVFFPEWQMIGGGGNAVLRRELIKLDACHRCNNGRSKEDEYAFLCIVSCLRVNEIAFPHMRDKVKRVLANQPALRKQFGASLSPVDFFGVKTMQAQVDGHRLKSWCAVLCKGLWYHAYRQRLEGKVQIVVPEIRISGPSIVPGTDGYIRLVESELNQLDLKGENPEVFQFRTCHLEERGIFLAQLIFYGGVNIYGAYGDGLEGF